MAKKFGKFLLCAAAICGAAAAAYQYLQKKDAITISKENNDEDYDDFSEETEETPSRSYVSLTKELTNDAITEEVIADDKIDADAIANDNADADEIAEDEAIYAENDAEADAPTPEVVTAVLEEQPAPEVVEEFFGGEDVEKK